jgi:hypothetical protein
MSLKNSSDTIGNRTRDLPGCSTVPQPTAPPRAPDPISNTKNLHITNFDLSEVYRLGSNLSHGNLHQEEKEQSTTYVLFMGSDFRL